MSTMQRMTLIGLYNYENTFSRDLFRNLSLPEGYDKTTFVNSLLLEHGEKCVLYTNPDFFVQAIGVWGDKYALELSRIYEALTAEYNPVWNYDRYEEITDGHGKHYVSQTYAGHTASDSPDFSVEQVTSGNVEHQVSADNDSNYQPESKDITNAGKTKTSGKTQDLTENSNATTTDDESITDSHNGHIWGNIGVTTSTQMISDVVRQRFNMSLYGVVAKMFANELLIGIF